MAVNKKQYCRRRPSSRSSPRLDVFDDNKQTEKLRKFLIIALFKGDRRRRLYYWGICDGRDGKYFWVRSWVCWINLQIDESDIFIFLVWIRISLGKHVQILYLCKFYVKADYLTDNTSLQKNVLLQGPNISFLKYYGSLIKKDCSTLSTTNNGFKMEKT